MRHTISLHFFHRISKYQGESWKYDAPQSIVVELRSIWKFDGTLCQGFDIFLMSLVILGNLCYTPKFRFFFFSCNRLSGQDFIVLQRLMKEPIEDVQVNQLLKSRCCARVARAAKAELGVRKMSTALKTRTQTAWGRRGHLSRRDPYRLCIDAVPSLYRPYTDPVSTL